MPGRGLTAFYWLLVFIPLLVFTGCERRPDPSELKSSLGKVAEQYWTYRFIKGNFRSAYDLELEEGRPPFKQYVDKVTPAGQIRYLNVKTKEVTIDQDKGVVLLTVEHEIPIPGVKVKKAKPLQGTIRDVWIYTSDGWRHKGKSKN
ncbi:MAG: hypothetical protein ISS61_12775 [Desulfobacteraceae bacterium]|nr:hypothetical protein [Desulfobacteraceae bacterium]